MKTILFLVLAIFLVPFKCLSDTLDDIKHKNEIVIGTEAKFPPFEFIEEGKIKGFSQDILDIIFRDKQINVKRIDVPFQSIIIGLKTKKFDYIATGLTATEERDKKYRLSIPIADATVAMLVRNDGEINTLEELSGKVIGSQTGSTLIKEINSLSDKFESKSLKRLKIKEYVNFDEAYMDLSAKRVDGVAQSFANLSYLVSKNPNKYKILDKFGRKQYFVWMARKDKDDESLANFFDSELKKLIEDGTIYKLQEKWFGFKMEVPSNNLKFGE